MPKRCQWSWKMDTIWPNVPRCICSLILIDVWLWYHNFYLSWVSWILFENERFLSICVFDSITVSGNFVFFPKKSKWIHGLDICQFHDFGLFLQCLKIIEKKSYLKKNDHTKIFRNSHVAFWRQNSSMKKLKTNIQIFLVFRAKNQH